MWNTRQKKRKTSSKKRRLNREWQRPSQTLLLCQLSSSSIQNAQFLSWFKTLSQCTSLFKYHTTTLLPLPEKIVQGCPCRCLSLSLLSHTSQVSHWYAAETALGEVFSDVLVVFIPGISGSYYTFHHYLTKLGIFLFMKCFSLSL